MDDDTAEVPVPVFLTGYTVGIPREWTDYGWRTLQLPWSFTPLSMAMDTELLPQSTPTRPWLFYNAGLGYSECAEQAWVKLYVARIS